PAVVGAVQRFDTSRDLFDELAVFGLTGGDIGSCHVSAGGIGEVNIAPLGDQEGVIAGLGHLVLIGQESTHFLGGLDVVAVAAELKPVGIGHGAARLHAQQRPMGFVIAGVGVVRIVGGHRLKAEILADT